MCCYSFLSMIEIASLERGLGVGSILLLSFQYLFRLFVIFSQWDVVRSVKLHSNLWQRLLFFLLLVLLLAAHLRLRFLPLDDALDTFRLCNGKFALGQAVRLEVLAFHELVSGLAELPEHYGGQLAAEGERFLRA